MKVSIVTVVFNNKETILEAISSVRSQTWKNLEHIIIDGASYDGTKEILMALDGPAILISEVDRGIYDAMNKGIKLATGEVVGILNSDDLYIDDKILEEVVNLFICDNDLDIVYCDLLYVSKENVNKIIRRWDSKSYYTNFFEDGHVPPHPALFVRRRVYKTAGGFNLKFKLAADYEFMLRIFKKHNFKSLYFQRLAVKMRLGGATNKSVINIIKGNLEIYGSWKVNKLAPPLLFFPKRIIRRIRQYFL